MRSKVRRAVVGAVLSCEEVTASAAQLTAGVNKGEEFFIVCAILAPCYDNDGLLDLSCASVLAFLITSDFEMRV